MGMWMHKFFYWYSSEFSYTPNSTTFFFCRTFGTEVILFELENVNWKTQQGFQLSTFNASIKGYYLVLIFIT
jgi:hypothetical protein